MNERLEAIKKRLEAATPGEWKRGIGNECREVCVQFGPKIADVYGADDGTFIAHSRTDLSWAAEVIQEADQMAKAAQALVAPYHTAMGGGNPQTQAVVNALAAYTKARGKQNG